MTSSYDYKITTEDDKEDLLYTVKISWLNVKYFTSYQKQLTKATATLMAFSGGCNAIIALQPPESCCSVAT